MDSHTIFLILILLLVVVCFWNKGCYNSPTTEYYKRKTLSEDGPMKRSPVTTAFQGDGMSGNPHHQSDPTDKLVPLEYGGDLYKPGRKLLAGQMYAELDECYRLGESNDNLMLINDNKTRSDMVSSGDMGWHRVLHNTPTELHVLDPAAGPVEADLVKINVDHQGLYYNSFHSKDGIGN